MFRRLLILSPEQKYIIGIHGNGVIAITEDIDGGIGKAIVFGETKYVHSADEENDYLLDDSDNKVKVNLTFSKSKVKNELAKKGLKAFFRGVWS